MVARPEQAVVVLAVASDALATRRAALVSRMRNGAGAGPMLAKNVPDTSWCGECTRSGDSITAGDAAGWNTPAHSAWRATGFHLPELGRPTLSAAFRPHTVSY